MSAETFPYDPETGRPPADPKDTRDPMTVPQWSLGSFGNMKFEDDDKTGITDIEARIVECLEETFKRLQRAKRGTLYWGELLYECRGIKRAWDALYHHPWSVGGDGPKSTKKHPSNNPGCSYPGWALQLEWQARLY